MLDMPMGIGRMAWGRMAIRYSIASARGAIGYRRRSASTIHKRRNHALRFYSVLMAELGDSGAHARRVLDAGLLDRNGADCGHATGAGLGYLFYDSKT